MPAASLQSLTTGQSITFPFWEGQLMTYQPIGDFYQRLGATGEGVQTLGNLGPDCDITANYLANSAALSLSVQGFLLALQASYVRVIEPDGTQWGRVLVKDAKASRRRGAYPYQGSVYSYRVEARLTLAVQAI